MNKKVAQGHIRLGYAVCSMVFIVVTDVWSNNSIEFRLKTMACNHMEKSKNNRSKQVVNICSRGLVDRVWAYKDTRPGCKKKIPAFPNDNIV